MTEETWGIVLTAVVLGVWIVPIPISAWVFSKKCYSSHWSWLGLVGLVVPCASVIVLAIALLLPKQSEGEPKAPLELGVDANLSRSQYQKGMRDLGNGMIGLGVLQTLASAVLLFSPAMNLIAFMVVAVMATTFISLGVFARLMHSWVNYAVLVLGALLLAMNIQVLSLLGQEDTKPNPIASFSNCFAIIIAAALIFFSISNIKKRSERAHV